MDRKYIDLTKNISLITVGKATSKLVNILILPFYTSFLSPENYGSIDMVTAYCAMFLQPVTLCIDSAVFVFSSRKTNSKKVKYYSSGFFISVFPIALFCLVMYALTNLSKGCDESSFFRGLTQNSLLLCLLVCSGFLVDFLQQMLRSLNKISQYAAIGVLQSLSMILFSIILLPKWGVRGYLYSMVMSSIMVVLVMFVNCRLWKWLSVRAIDVRYYSQMLRFSLPLIPAPLLVWVQFQSNRPILAATCGMTAVGIFGFATRFPSVINYLADSLCKSWEISAINENMKSDFPEFYNRLSLAFFVAGASVCLIFPVVVEPVFKVLITKEFHSAVQYIPVVTLSVFLGVCGQLLGTNLTVRKQSYKFFWSSVVAAVVVGGGNWLLIPKFGVWGACLPMALGSLSVMLVRYFISDAKFRVMSANRIGVGLIIMAVWSGAYVCYSNSLATSIAISGVALILILLLFVSKLKRMRTCHLRRA